MFKATATTLLVLGAQLCTAINFSDWAPRPDLPKEFKPFLEALVNAAEARDVTTGYTDYFPADGMQTTLTIHCVGANGIQKCKEGFLANGRDIVHFPNTTFVVSNNNTATVYESQGRIEMTFPEPPGNCSQQYYKTQYTVLKTDQTVEALPNLSLKPEGQVYWYHDYYVDPPTQSTDIACDSKK
ncbi:hypothetical protein CLAFUW4_06963 [Fulvia fulva]|uniref:Uncharacterized protein n=1 Tax=Passalora fulva TaxID=5499 RepID=A0A9Q8PA93_PASFU|nr:uncharacterized protein CLAFUR5_07099 [Fulvia fulva]KAK4621533.1 hypothetical protein CLAFUR4_06972 [Fulvia fulva]KAK4622476.1 hypothetical protein CLAFUR0_06970 [Fulvia fulva]UJO18754.1 hypothetical protein CLAFUR5_07099 [Fulvia fulva]WPV16203.1 hypothetical protein CLAFUW4_06963 [Fulvia fulva]WPV30928.1 hypothetical protein CLAFUW7_06963 [Fulvia fulva]